MSLFDFCENIPPGYLGWILIAYTLDYLSFVESARYLDIVGVVKKGGKTANDPSISSPIRHVNEFNEESGGFSLTNFEFLLNI